MAIVPVTAVSADGSMVAVHTPSSSSSSSSTQTEDKLLIKCYDAKVSLSSLKFTLSAKNQKLDIVSMAFSASNKYLAAMTQSRSQLVSNQILLFDMQRGVHSGTIQVALGNQTNTGTDASAALTDGTDLCCIALPTECSSSSSSSSSSGVSENKDADDHDTTLYALVHRDGKTLVLAYDLLTLKLLKKIKVASCDSHQLSTLAIHAHQRQIAVKIANKIKVINSIDGSTLFKAKIKTDHHTNAADAKSFIRFSNDGQIMVANSPNQIHFFSAVGDHAGNTIGSAPMTDISNVHIRNHNRTALDHAAATPEYIVATTPSNGETSYLFHIQPKSCTKKTVFHPFAHIAQPTSSTHNSVLESFFHNHASGDDVIMMLLTTKGFNNVNVQMTRLPYILAQNDNDGNAHAILCTGNLYPKNDNDGNDNDNPGKDTSHKKRKALPTTAATVAANPGIVLGHGEAGGEVMTVTDATTNAKNNKRAKLDNISDDDVEVETNDDDEGITIAQKLAILSTQLDQEQKEDDRAKNGHDSSIILAKNEKKHKNGIHGGIGTTVGVRAESTKSFIKNATSDSLVILLRQALLASDDGQLEVVLRVTDKKVIENTIIALTDDHGSEYSSLEQNQSSDLVVGLLTKLVTRLSRKPTRAHQLSFWIRTVLMVMVSCAAKEENGGGRSGAEGANSGQGSWRMAAANKDIAAKLAPLKSLLHDRVESLPELMRLEGRLGLIGKQF